jgi:hypothetical protein
VERNPLDPRHPVGSARVERPLTRGGAIEWRRSSDDATQFILLGAEVQGRGFLGWKSPFRVMLRESYADSPLMCVGDYYSSSGIFNAFAGRDHVIPVRDSDGQFVALVFVTRLVYDDGGSSRPEQVMREAHWSTLVGCER